MLIDTHCHLNIMAKKRFDTPLVQEDFQTVHAIIEQAKKNRVTAFINIGTSLIESRNSLELAEHFTCVYASVGIHPNDLTPDWTADFAHIKQLVSSAQYAKLVAIGECGLDFHYPDYNKSRQQDGFKAQIELALEHDLPLVIHTRDAGHETLTCLQEFKDQALRGTMHCFSEDVSWAQEAINLGFVLGIGGTITYPKNTVLRTVVKTVGIEHIVLETDAPYLPIQRMRGKENSPAYIYDIAQYVGELTEQPWEYVAQVTNQNVYRIFGISST